MKNINNKSIVLSLAILAILTLTVITMPAKALADRAGYVTPYDDTNFSNVSSNEDYNNYVGPRTSGSGTSGTYSTPTVYSGTTVYTAPKTTTVKKTTTAKKSTASTTATEDTSDLAANAIYGSNSFLPSGLIQWILLAIFILLIVILVRKVTGAEDKYHSEPLKHA